MAFQAGWHRAIRERNAIRGKFETHMRQIRGSINAGGDKPDSDRMIIEQLRLPARVGVYAHEKNAAQPICLSLEIGLPNQDCYASDELADTICYMTVTDAVRALAVSRHFNLVEALAEKIALEVLGHGASWVTVRVGKIGIVAGAQAVDIVLTRQSQVQAAAPADIAATAH